MRVSAAVHIIIAASLLILSGACTKSESKDGRPTLLVSIEPQKALLRELAGEEYNIVTLLPSGSDPESFDPPMSVRRAGDDAEIYFATGAFPFERTMAGVISCPTLYATDSLELIYGTHGHEHGHEHCSHGSCEHAGHHHDHEAADPHVWTSVRNMKTMAAGMTASLIRLNPDSAAVYRSRLETLGNRLDSLDAVIGTRLADAPSFAIWHPSLSYFARDYQLNQHALGLEGKDMSVGQIRRAIDSAISDSVRVFIIEPGTDPERARTVASNIGARLVTINLMNPQWEQELIHLSDEIASDTAQ